MRFRCGRPGLEQQRDGPLLPVSGAESQTSLSTSKADRKFKPRQARYQMLLCFLRRDNGFWYYSAQQESLAGSLRREMAAILSASAIVG
jgi:hypothetical protein